jgi:hypothetical protein
MSPLRCCCVSALESQRMIKWRAEEKHVIQTFGAYFAFRNTFRLTGGGEVKLCSSLNLAIHCAFRKQLLQAMSPLHLVLCSKNVPPQCWISARQAIR